MVEKQQAYLEDDYGYNCYIGYAAHDGFTIYKVSFIMHQIYIISLTGLAIVIIMKYSTNTYNICKKWRSKMSHYYSKNPDTPHDLGKIEYNINGVKLEFITDAGVFSKERVDYGSHVMLSTLPKVKGTLLDLGCGYGALGITIARLNEECRVTMVDINERAIGLTKENIALNGIKNTECFQSDGFENVKGRFDYIVTNPPIRTGKKVIYPMFEKSIEFLNPGGEIYMVIQKKQGAESAKEKLISIYGSCDVINKDAGYWILKSVYKAE